MEKLGINQRVNGTAEEQERAMQETAEMALKGRASSALNIAFMDFKVASSGGDVDSFLQSKAFQDAVEKHKRNYFSEKGISEAIQILKDKHPKPKVDSSSVDTELDRKYKVGLNNSDLSSARENDTPPVIPTGDALRLETDDEVEARIRAQDIPIVDSLRLKTDKEVEARIKALDDRYSVSKSTDRSVAANDSIFETAKQDDVVELEKPVALKTPSAPQASAQLLREEIIPDLNLPSSEVNVSNIVTPVASVEQFQPAPVQGAEAEKSSGLPTEEVPVVELIPEEIVRSAEPTVTPKVPLTKAEEVRAGIETNESPAFKEVLQEFTKSYVALFKNFRQYNNETLDRNGRETSESILFNSDIEDVIAFLSAKNAESGLADEVAKIEKVRLFLVENLFPVRGGMMISSIEGYDFLIDTLSDFERSVRGSYEKTKGLPEAGEFVQVLEQVHATFGNFDDMVKRKKQLTLDYLSR